MSWRELASKIGVKHLNGSVEPFFHRLEVVRGVRIAQVASHRAEEARKNIKATPGKESSLSQK